MCQGRLHCAYTLGCHGRSYSLQVSHKHLYTHVVAMLYCYTFTQLTVGIYGDIYFTLLPYPANRSTTCTLNLTAQPPHLHPQRWPCVADKCHTFSLSPGQPVATQMMAWLVPAVCCTLMWSYLWGNKADYRKCTAMYQRRVRQCNRDVYGNVPGMSTAMYQGCVRQCTRDVSSSVH